MCLNLSVVQIFALACTISASFSLVASSIPLGSKILPGDSTGWVSSPNQSFHVAFYPANSESTRFSLGILYYTPGINTTFVWTAGSNVQVGSSGSFELASDGNLLLKNDTTTTVWNSSTSGINVTEGSMGDDGNFMLLNSSSATVWQSFDSPTDTLVMNQKLQQGKSLTNGEYTASMQNTGNLALTYTGNGGYTYWTSSTNTTGSNQPYYALLQNSGNLSGGLSVFNSEGQALETWYSKDYTVSSLFIWRVTLDTDGNLRIYSWSSGGTSSSWSVGWQALQDVCDIYAYCGSNGLCGYNDTGVMCSCVTEAGYEFIDENNPRSGCKRIAGNGGQNCSPAIMVELNNTLLFVSSTSNTKFRYGDVQCESRCLTNSICTASTALSDGSGTCELVTGSGTFFSGYTEFSITTNSYFKYCGQNVPPAGIRSSNVDKTTGNGKSTVTVSVVVSVLATIVIFALVQGGLWWICCRRNPKWGGYSAHYALMEYASGAPVQLTYRQIKRATKNFMEKLGEGGFGAVYKGELPALDDGGRSVGTEVAVKRLERLVEQGEKQFRMEVAVIGSTHHMNLVRLCGFCAEGKHRLLVYEYMKNGSLDRYLFVRDGETQVGGEGLDGDQLGDGGENSDGRHVGTGRLDMNWEIRFNVLLGTARGITYLHQECRDCIIHSDIKPENILLDDTFNAKVSDFGLARLTRTRNDPRAPQVTTLIRGTRGYLAPEWRSNLPITVKSDVFSFGMVALEMVSGRKSFHFTGTSMSTQMMSFPEWAYRQYFLHKKVEEVVDERIKDDVDKEQLERVMRVAFWCMQVQPSSRPSMSRVVQMLDGSLRTSDVPPIPKSFGDHTNISITSADQENPLMSRVFEQESSSYRASTAATISSSLLNTGFTCSASSPQHALSQSLISSDNSRPPLSHDNVAYSF